MLTEHCSVNTRCVSLSEIASFIVIVMIKTIIVMLFYNNNDLEDDLEFVSLPNNCQLHRSRLVGRHFCIDVAHLGNIYKY